ncbi:MAG: hypothetical protein J1F63_03635 [Oscillospiraceae bacterium]|nr:hypothetical protein [Oscillospiraceae bacterium]
MIKIRRGLAVLICAVIILALMPAFSVNAAAVSISSAQAVASGGEIIVTVTTKNLPKNAVLMAASYDEDGALLDTERVVNKKAVLSASGVFDVKVFCWSSLTSMKPLCAAASPVIKHELDVVVSSTYLNTDTYDSHDRGIRFTANSDYSSDKYAGSRYVGGLVKGDSIDVVFDEGDTNAASLLGYACKVSVGYDKASGRDVIFEITPIGNQNGVTTIDRSMYAPEMDEGDGRVYYWKNRADDYAAAIELDENVRVFENYLDRTDISELNPDNNDYYYGLTQAYADYFWSGGSARFIDNDGDGDADYVLAEAYTAEAVIGGVSENGGRWSFIFIAGNIDDYDENDTEVYARFVKNGKEIGVSELSMDDTVTAVEGENGVIVYYVSSMTVTGTAGRYDSEEHTIEINGKSYGVSPVNGLGAYDVRGKEGKFHLNADGLISWFREDLTSVGSLGFVTGITETVKYNTTAYKIDLVDETGRTRSYPISGYIRYYSGGTDYENIDAGELLNSDDGIFREFIGWSPRNRVIRYQLTNGNISRIYVDGYDAFSSNRLNASRGYDSAARTFGGMTFNKNAKVFIIDLESDYTNPKNVKVGTLSAMLENGTGYSGWAYGEIYDAQAALIVGERHNSGGEYKTANVFVVDDAEVTHIGGDVAINVSGYSGGEKESFIIYDPDDPSVAEEFYNSKKETCTLAKGTVLMKGASKDGYVKNAEVILWTWANGDGLYPETPGFDDAARNEYTDENGILIVQDMAHVDVAATDEMHDNQRVVLDRYLVYGGGYRPDENNTAITVVDASDAENVTVRNGRARDLHIGRNDGMVGVVYFRAVDPDDRLDSFDIWENRGSVKDIVLYLFDENEYRYIPW